MGDPAVCKNRERKSDATNDSQWKAIFRVTLASGVFVTKPYVDTIKTEVADNDADERSHA